MAIEVFIVESSGPHVSVYSNPAAFCGTGIPACPLCKWLLLSGRQTGMSVLREILFAGCGRYDSMRRLVLHSSRQRFANLQGRIFRTMAQNARLPGLGVLVLCTLLYP